MGILGGGRKVYVLFLSLSLLPGYHARLSLPAHWVLIAGVAPVRFGSHTVWGWNGRALPVFGSGSSSAKRAFLWFSTVYRPPENFRSQDKMFLELISLCKCNFSSFHNSFFMQVQVGVLPEFIFKQVVMQVPFSSIPGFGVLS